MRPEFPRKSDPSQVADEPALTPQEKKRKKRREKRKRQRERRRLNATPETLKQDDSAPAESAREKFDKIMAEKRERRLGGVRKKKPSQKRNKKLYEAVRQKGAGALLKQLGVENDQEARELVMEVLRTGECQNPEQLVARLTQHQVQKEAKADAASMQGEDVQDLHAGPAEGPLQKLPGQKSLAGLHGALLQ